MNGHRPLHDVDSDQGRRERRGRREEKKKPERAYRLVRLLPAQDELVHARELSLYYFVVWFEFERALKICVGSSERRARRRLDLEDKKMFS